MKKYIWITLLVSLFWMYVYTMYTRCINECMYSSHVLLTWSVVPGAAPSPGYDERSTVHYHETSTAPSTYHWPATEPVLIYLTLGCFNVSNPRHYNQINVLKPLWFMGSLSDLPCPLAGEFVELVTESLLADSHLQFSGRKVEPSHHLCGVSSLFVVLIVTSSTCTSHCGGRGLMPNIFIVRVLASMVTRIKSS